MIRLLDNVDLSKYNTFHLKAKAKRFFEFTESEELLTFLQREQLPDNYLILGGGSNLLFQNDYEGLIIHPNIPGIVEEKEDRSYSYIEAGAGMEWDEMVALTVSYELGGLENLSLIPGKVGAAPVQNIGAYGVEARDRIYMVRGIDLRTAERIEFSNEDCNFSYRNSIFKNELKNQIVITSVVFRLDKFPEYNLDYGALRAEVEKLGEPNLHNVRKAVISIRESKLPDPDVLGNAGSFFKNPVVVETEANELKKSYPEMPVYPAGEGLTKLAAGWLIDKSGWRGYRKGNCGIHKDQALVLVNYGDADGKELVNLALDVKNSVKEKFGIELEPEVNIIG